MPVGMISEFISSSASQREPVSNMSGQRGDTSAGGVAADSAAAAAAATDGGACTMTETDVLIRSSLALGSSEEYKMNNKRRGLALIFNQETFFWRLGLNDRNGTNVDCDNLERRLKALNFEVKTHHDLRQMDVITKIWEASEDDHSDADCFLIAFLSHGEKDHVWTHDGMIRISDITSRFKGDKCPSLVGKPKIFIFQACRGTEPDDSVTACTTGESGADEVMADASALYTLPAGADFMMCYSVAEGYVSFRNPINGSWYIQDLCELLEKYGDSLEFTELLTWLNRKVSTRSVPFSKQLKLIGKKQIPCFASMLTKKLYFHPKK